MPGPIADRLALLARPDWQMTFGERAALEGMVAALRPALAIEVGTAEGGSLERIAAHSEEVHAIDLSGALLRDRPENVTFHEGDSKVLLPELLEGLAHSGRRVEFALVDGDHSAAGARADLAALLESPALGDAVILVHDSFNADVRAGIESVALAERPRVVGFDLDFVPGRLGRAGAFADQLLGGFAAIVLAAEPTSGKLDLGLWSLDPDPVLAYDSHAAATRLADLLADDDAQPSERLLLAPDVIRRAELERRGGRT